MIGESFFETMQKTGSSTRLSLANCTTPLGDLWTMMVVCHGEDDNVVKLLTSAPSSATVTTCDTSFASMACTSVEEDADDAAVETVNCKIQVIPVNSSDGKHNEKPPHLLYYVVLFDPIVFPKLRTPLEIF